MVRYAMAIDMSRCMGCRACVSACKVENNTPRGIFWMWVFRFEEGDYPDSKIRYMPHCDNAPCTKVCPVGARFKRDDGLVLTDVERCIGCRYCEVSCPYGVNYFNWKKPSKNQYYDWGSSGLPYRNPDHELKYEGRLVSGGNHFVGVMGKCTFCVHRLIKGLEPACVAKCVTKCLHFGKPAEVTDTRRERHAKAMAAMATGVCRWSGVATITAPRGSRSAMAWR